MQPIPPTTENTESKTWMLSERRMGWFSWRRDQYFLGDEGLFFQNWLIKFEVKVNSRVDRAEKIHRTPKLKYQLKRFQIGNLHSKRKEKNKKALSTWERRLLQAACHNWQLCITVTLTGLTINTSVPQWACFWNCLYVRGKPTWNQVAPFPWVGVLDLFQRGKCTR